MLLVAGLGNPGEKYRHNRHNIGFLIVDDMIKNLNTYKISNQNFQAKTFKYNNTIYLQAQTYMNNSGISIKSVVDYFDIATQNIIVIYDDIDLNFGTIRFKIGGTSAGHNGIKSIDSHIKKSYLKIRVGVGKPDKEVSNYLLSNLSKIELNNIATIATHISNSIEFYISNYDINMLKSKYTTKELI